MKARNAVVVAVARRPSAAVEEVFEGVDARLVLRPDGVYSLSQASGATTNGDVPLTGTGCWQRDGALLRLVPHTSGDVRRFTRLPNGDLRLIDRRRADVAQTVLRRQRE